MNSGERERERVSSRREGIEGREEIEKKNELTFSSLTMVGMEVRL